MLYSVDKAGPVVARLVGEDGAVLEYPAWLLPQGAAEGDMLRFTGVQLLLDKAETEERRKRVGSLLDQILHTP